MVKLDEHKQHLKNLISQYQTAKQENNYKKVKDLKKGIKRTQQDIWICEKYLGIKSNYERIAL